MKYDELILNIPLYHGELGIVVTDDLEKLIENHGIDPMPIIYGHSFLLNNKGMQIFLIVLNPYGKIKVTHGVVSHEAIHIANMIFQRRDIEPDLDNDEPYAYLVEGIVNEVYKFLAKLKVRLSLEKE